MNVANGQDIVISSAALVLQSMVAEIKSEIPNINTVYDESLSYATAIRKYRSKNSSNSEKKPFYPLLAYDRSVLRHSDIAAPGRRLTAMSVRHKVDDITRHI